MNNLCVGDKVVAITRKNTIYYPYCGTEGVVRKVDRDAVLVEWAFGTTAGNGVWWCYAYEVEKKSDVEEHHTENNEVLDGFLSEWEV